MIDPATRALHALAAKRFIDRWIEKTKQPFSVFQGIEAIRSLGTEEGMSLFKECLREVNAEHTAGEPTERPSRALSTQTYL